MNLSQSSVISPSLVGIFFYIYIIHLYFHLLIIDSSVYADLIHSSRSKIFTPHFSFARWCFFFFFCLYYHQSATRIAAPKSGGRNVLTHAYTASVTGFTSLFFANTLTRRQRRDGWRDMKLYAAEKKKYILAAGGDVPRRS